MKLLAALSVVIYFVVYAMCLYNLLIAIPEKCKKIERLLIEKKEEAKCTNEKE